MTVLSHDANRVPSEILADQLYRVMRNVLKPTKNVQTVMRIAVLMIELSGPIILFVSANRILQASYVPSRTKGVRGY